VDKKLKLSKLWDSLLSSFWFVPTLMLAIVIGLAIATLAIDAAFNIQNIKIFGGIFAKGPQGAGRVLSTIASSMLTVAGTTFSIAIVALQLASSQFGPRMLRDFMQDRVSQIVLGTFTSTFLYCVLVLWTIEGDQGKTFVPQFSILVSVLLAIVSIGVLIYFIHHTAESIHADNLIAKINRELENVIDRLFPQNLGQEPPEPKGWIEEIPTNFDDEACPVLSTCNGYIQRIDTDWLIKIAKDNDLLFRVLYRPGKFVVKGSELVKVWPGERVNQKLAAHINKAFICGSQRTQEQDVEFPIKQLVEMAIRAISPAVNNPFTAIRCIDHLSAALSHLVQKDIPSPYRYDDKKNLRVIVDQVKFEGIVDAAFSQIRHYGRSDVSVTVRLLEAIAVIAAHTRNKKYRLVLLRHADMIVRGSQDGLPEEWDRKSVEEQYQKLVRALKPQ
jgi:uncharacterized membrane protein